MLSAMDFYFDLQYKYLWYKESRENCAGHNVAATQLLRLENFMYYVTESIGNTQCTCTSNNSKHYPFSLYRYIRYPTYNHSMGS